MILLVFLTGGIYIIVIASFFYGWEKLLRFQLPKEYPSVFASIIVPMRDEEGNITNLINDLIHQNYPLGKYEIIVVDDHSSDRSIAVIAGYAVDNLKVITLPEGINGKKAALNFGIKDSKGELIVTTDADCRRGSNWLRSIVSYYQQTNPVMILAPVVPSYNSHSFWKMGWEKALSLELYSLLGSTAGSAAIGHPVMCNGANLAFPRSVYPFIESVYQNTHVPSGDDMFAMFELKKKYPGRIHFLKSKEAAVFTDVSASITSFFKQRGRWASKAKFYREPATIFTALAVVSINIILVFTLIYSILYQSFTSFFILLIIKSLVDFPFLYRVTSFFGQLRLMLWFPIVQSLYFFYVCMTVFVAIFLPNGWKGRRI